MYYTAHFDGSKVGRNYPLVQSGDISMVFPKQLKKFDWGANLILDTVKQNNTLPPVVMSAAIGYPLDRFQAFVGSLRKVYSGDVSNCLGHLCRWFHHFRPSLRLCFVTFLSHGLRHWLVFRIIRYGC